MDSNRWTDGILACQATMQPYVLLTVMGSVGSTPRNAGTKMVVTQDRLYDTIGGGNLEHQSIAKAKAMLMDKGPLQHLEHFPLAASLAQCCGGATHVLFEVFNQHTHHLVLFGAGHVAKALVPIIQQLPINITWIDNREAMFDATVNYANVEKRVFDEPASAFGEFKQAFSCYVMTHDHQLDFDITKAALHQNQCQFVGLIGSATKSKRFFSKLTQQNVTKTQLEKLACPVGLPEIQGKLPVEVAVSIAGQVIQQLQPQKAEKDTLKQAWKNTKEIADLL